MVPLIQLVSNTSENHIDQITRFRRRLIDMTFNVILIKSHEKSLWVDVMYELYKAYNNRQSEEG